MKYIRDGKIITASEKAFNAIYKEQGYEKMQDQDITNMNTGELKALAKEKGLEGYSKLTKEELITLLKDCEE